MKYCEEKWCWIKIVVKGPLIKYGYFSSPLHLAHYMTSLILQITEANILCTHLCNPPSSLRCVPTKPMSQPNDKREWNENYFLEEKRFVTPPTSTHPKTLRRPEKYFCRIARILYVVSTQYFGHFWPNQPPCIHNALLLQKLIYLRRLHLPLTIKSKFQI